MDRCRRAALGGQIVTDYLDFASVEFHGGLRDLHALEQTSLRPDPPQWDPVTASYTGTNTAPAALGARVRATYMVILTFDAAFMAIRDLDVDMDDFGIFQRCYSGANPPADPYCAN